MPEPFFKPKGRKTGEQPTPLVKSSKEFVQMTLPGIEPKEPGDEDFWILSKGIVL